MYVMDEAGQSTDITALLLRWQAGEAGAYDQVMLWAHQRMVAIAAGFVARERIATEPAALVNEAYLRLRRLAHIQWRDRHHFFSLVAAELRRILVDQARSRIAQKREGNLRRVPLTDDLRWIDAQGHDMLDLELALQELEQLDPDKVRLMELKYVMGCSLHEIAELRGISETTVERHLRFVRAWLYERLRAEPA
jgi:RNA polymerase sigma factor (TIGR02999 family)